MTGLKPHELMTAIRERVTPTALTWLNGASQMVLDELTAIGQRRGIDAAAAEVETLAEALATPRPAGETAREQIEARQRRVATIEHDIAALDAAAERLDSDPLRDALEARVRELRQLRRELLNEILALEEQHGLLTTRDEMLAGFEPPAADDKE